MAALAEEGQAERNLPFLLLASLQDGAQMPPCLTEVLREVLLAFVMGADGRRSLLLLSRV